MSGIAGIIHFDSKPVQLELIEKMTSAMAHRGPDSVNHWIDGSVALGQCMLRSTPESVHENPPLINESDSLVLVMDGRLDNHTELSAKLRAKGCPPRNVTDAELVLKAYQVWGEDAPQHILGDFAFAIWDIRRRTLFCARDHFGVKPFYYYREQNLLVFASEPKGVVACSAVHFKINEARIADYLVESLEGIDKTSTFYQDVLRLPPAHTLRADNRDIRLRNYWELIPQDEIRFSSDKDYEAAFLDIFKTAIACRLRSSTPAASMLSGGLDSSSIVGLARELVPPGQKLLTFSAATRDGENCPETRAIHSVLQAGEYAPTLIYPDEIETFLSGFYAFEKRQDDLFDTWMVIPQLMYAAAKKRGCKTLLDGIPGDEVASLPGQYIAGLLRQGHWMTAWWEAQGVARFYRAFNYSALQVFKANFKLAVAPKWVRSAYQQLKLSKQLRSTIAESMMHPDFARRIELASRLKQLRAAIQIDVSSDINIMHAQLLQGPYLTVGLERYDRVAGAYGIEPRHPLLDKRLVEFCVNLPWRQKVHNGWTKYVMRRALAGYIPDSVRWRAGRDHLAKDFNCSFTKLRNERIIDFLNCKSDTLNQYLDNSAVQGAYTKALEDASKQNWSPLWGLAELDRWLREALDF